MTEFARWLALPLTYPEVEATRPGRRLPADAHSMRLERRVGSGRERFDQVRAMIATYQMQRGAGLRVRASTDSAQVGTIIILSPPVPAPVTIACRVVYVLDEPRRAGFAYGTLPGHPESGEELFTVELRADGSVVAVVTAFSRPGRWFTRLGGPVARLAQRAMARRYLAAVSR